ncbi:hypothetical protein LGH82_21055 [Mesorhizobium sp. PAMC28654]|uniref:hypothetical protein n=1 Tax=Mesorhizobium sp. PAMC28654 TaxID=2880934 RepID=UPI001D0B78F4|nr:hypothetical protein [Mesorhizobium sp. PAMC28654]UDL87655.1 hypothetical protein LGH82_21055 [Mesorhizobium sp. PAMC28654]
MPKNEFTREEISAWRKDQKTVLREEYQEKLLKKRRTSQRKKRDWISVEDIAKYLGRETGTDTVDEKKRLELAYWSICSPSAPVSQI